MNPIRELRRGSRVYWQGVKWLKQHPFWLLLLMVPSFLALLGMAALGHLFLKNHAALVAYFLFEPGESWFWVILYNLAWLLFHALAFVAVLLIGLVVSNILAVPIYEAISQAVERDVWKGEQDEIGFWQSLRGVPEELKKFVLVALLSVGFFLIPGLNFLALFFTAYLLAWDFYDYPLARRGLKLKERLRIARGDSLAILGMSVWFLIPILHFVMVPLAIAGGSLLSLETLARRPKYEAPR